MILTQQYQETINQFKKDGEKVEIYPYVFKYEESEKEYYYYALYKKYQEGKGLLVLSSNRGLIPKQEAVEISYYFLTHNGTALTANKVINKVKKRKKEYVEEIIQLLLKNKEKLAPVQNSLHNVLNILQLQANNTDKLNEIYQDIVEIDNEIYDRTKTLTKALWQKGIDLVNHYDGLIYSEFKEVLNNIQYAEEIILYLKDGSHFSLMEGLRAKKLAKKMEELYGEKAKSNLQKSLQGFEKDLKGNFFTKTRGELSTEEYLQIINQMTEEDFKRNLLRDNRNP